MKQSVHVQKSEGPSMTITTLSIDLAKQIFHVLGADGSGQIVLRKKLTRKRLAQFICNLAPCVIGMEACAGAHYWAHICATVIFDETAN